MAREKGLRPIYTPESKVLILGTFPSAKSRQTGIYYANGGNRFWKVIGNYMIYVGLSSSYTIPDTIEKQKEVLKSCKIAVWDVIDECDIVGSKDSAIKNPKPNKLQDILQETGIKCILFNGKRAFNKYYNKEFKKEFKDLPVDHVILPSTSQQNTRYFNPDSWLETLSSKL